MKNVEQKVLKVKTISPNEKITLEGNLTGYSSICKGIKVGVERRYHNYHTFS